MSDTTDTTDSTSNADRTDATEERIREACERGDYRAGAAIVIAEYGPGLRGFLTAFLRGRSQGDEAYGMFSLDLVMGLERFRGQCKARSFAYVVARNAAHRYLKAERRYAEFPEAFRDELAAPVQTRTESYLKTDFKQRARALRERLSPDDQELLLLHVNRGLTFKEIALDSGLTASDEELDRTAARLRQRFGRMKSHLESLAIEDGLIQADRAKKKPPKTVLAPEPPTAVVEPEPTVEHQP